MATIQTVTGPIDSSELGRTLMHEHLVIAYAGWESDTLQPRLTRADLRDRCIERIREMQELGYSSMVDPCPNDLGRDPELMVEVAEATGFHIVCATGIYKEHEAGAAYWRFRASTSGLTGGPDLTGLLTELFTRELTDGIGTTGVRPGIIKVATGEGHMSEFERSVFDAAAAAAVATGAPITTHTDQGTIGDLQQQVLTAGGVASERIIIGHSCGSGDLNYHLRIARGGSYLGFDRFGLEVLRPDAERVASLAALLRAGGGDRVVVSHDSVWCWRGRPLGSPEVEAMLAESCNPSVFSTKIVPMLHEAGVTDDEIDRLVLDNPRRFFEGAPLPAMP